MDHSILNSDELHTLNLSGQGLKKLTRGHCPEDAHKVTSLSLDSNELQRLDNIDGFPNLIELSANHNQLLRMHSVNRLHHLVRLDLSHNNLLSIEGVKDLQHLKWLNLSGNNIKTIEHLHTNTNLEYLSLSENSISHISNLSHLIHLKNHIGGLPHCEMYLPTSLVTLTLAANNLTDLNHVSHLVRLVNLREFSIAGNPCVSMTGTPVGFDYRPFLINWCMGLKVIDGYAVDDIESLKAEWLYSQGRGRQFRVGEQDALVMYLTETCPLTHHQLETEHERKLRLILSKAQHHQQQLLRQEKPHHGKGGRGKPLKPNMSELMTRSLDPSLLDSCTTHTQESDTEVLLSQSMHCPPSLPTCLPIPAPLPAATQLVPVPESLVSPSVATPPAPLGPKLTTIRSRAQEKRDKKVDQELEKAAICIQKVWRGYHTRTSDRRVLSAYQQIQTLRTNQYIKKLSEDMQATREALDNEHKMQLLQMQAINALWKKVVSLQPRTEGGDVRDLTETCSRLNAQVQQLQESMQEVLRCVSPSHPATGSTTATQTDIVAVHTPQEPHPPRPSSLPLPPPPLTQYADCLVDGVIKTTVKEQEQPLEAETTHVS
ncbi:leucine-rich repeat and IQ domain-containing protein 1 isoform X2 [Macrosteles quadrilineatus]|uniref:leucine-rich repeat and IQ domain-containing protein 1 isoform X2 n=1 Tax=Macrosteles quadrilineatus TaxID=74068 RepID=UPI0023E25474|nr:leucine-rich repeat and IQ domain-containing protein 1 isoform X2 [Macrosteles quadrilineatus]